MKKSRRFIWYLVITAVLLALLGGLMLLRRPKCVAHLLAGTEEATECYVRRLDHQGNAEGALSGESLVRLREWMEQESAHFYGFTDGDSSDPYQATLYMLYFVQWTGPESREIVDIMIDDQGVLYRAPLKYKLSGEAADRLFDLLDDGL